MRTRVHRIKVGRMLTRTEIAVAAVCAAWAAASLAGEGWFVLAAPVFGAAVLPFRRRPVLATVAVSVASLALFAAGVSEENPVTLAAGLVVAYGLGRHAPALHAPVPLAALAAGLTAVDGIRAVDAVFVAFVLGVTWACGHLVRRSALRASRAAEHAAELAARDPAALAERAVAEERARIAGDALGVIRAAVETMCARAADAQPALDREALEAIQADGRAAVAELRRLLGLLRSEPAPGEPPPADPARRGPHVSRRLADAALVAALGALAILDAATWGEGEGAVSVALTLALVAAVGVRRFDAAAACLLATVPSLLAVVTDRPLAYGFAIVVACGLLAWAAAGDGRPRAWLALAALAAVTLAVVHVDSPGNEGIVLCTFALTAVAGRAWAERRREGRAASATAAELRAQHEAAIEQAARGERLRLARELHDVASHAVGAMVLQAGAALALRERDPAAAREAVATVRAAGAEATDELDRLFGLLDAGTVGPAGHAAHAEHDLGALAGRMRAGGLAVEVTGEPPDDPATAATVYRVVQEALTNAARYAPGARVDVALARHEGTLVVTVADDGPGAAHGRVARPGEPPVATGGGFGLVGLAERVRALGGELSAGPRTGGGFAVSARLPAAAREEARA